MYSGTDQVSRLFDFPYSVRSELPDPTVCVECGSVYLAGQWQWLNTSPKGAGESVCPACYRIHGNRPAGFLSLSGGYFDQHRDEIMNLALHSADEQKAQHPMRRVMNVEHAENGSVTITFTDARSPHSVAQAIMRAFQGKVEVKYPRATDVVHASWVR